MEPLQHPLFRFEKSPILRFLPRVVRSFACIGRGLARFFWNRIFLKFVLGLIALIFFFYVEEDWRGAHAWAVTKAEWEAKGESFDYTKFIPPPIPEDQNLGALQLFKIEPVKYSDGSSYPGLVNLRRAMRNELPPLDFSAIGHWQKGDLPDMAKIQKMIAANYSAAFKGAKAPDDTLDQFDALYPFLADFLAVAPTRPLCRLSEDYAVSPPMNRNLGAVTDQIELSQILTLHAILALDHHKSDLALEDLKINFKIASGVRHDPSLVGGLVAIAMTLIGDEAIYDGLAQHDWTDAQLVELEQMLKPINFLEDFQFSVRSEAAESITNIDCFKKRAFARPSVIFAVLPWTAENVPFWVGLIPPLPDGWWNHNKSRMADIILRELATVDPRSRRVFPEVSLDVQHQVEQASARFDAYAPWNVWATTCRWPLYGETRQFARDQVWIDEARIACALERYHLAHGVYSASLDALVPACIDELPHDILNGQPYHYQLRPDGTYILYSVGWNQTDDGGKVVYLKDYPRNPKVIDYKEGDWVWQTPQLNATKN